MVQVQKANTIQQLLSCITGLYQTNQITEQARNQMVLAVKQSVRTHDFTDFLTILSKNTKFCDYPEIVETCKTLIYQFNAKE